VGVWRYVGNEPVKQDTRGKYKGQSAFLCCPGPSLKCLTVDLCGEGRVVAALNTAYPKISPDIWFGMDDPTCYDSRLLTESFDKFWRGGYQNRLAKDKRLLEYPATYFLDCAKGGSIEEIFTRTLESDHFVWLKNTLAIAIHYLIWSGVKKIYMVGCDMGGAEDYWHGSPLPEEQRKANQKLYREQTVFIRDLQAEGRKLGVEFVSCTENSPLNDFLQYEPLEEVVSSFKTENTHRQEHAAVVEKSLRQPPEATFPSDPYASHLPVLDKYRNLWEGKKVFEVGAGKYSTPYFLEGAAELVTVEEADSAWLDKVRDAVGEKKGWQSFLVSSLSEGLQLASDHGPYAVSFIDGLADTRSEYLKQLFENTESLIIGHDILPMYKWDTVPVPEGWKRHTLREHGTIIWEREPEISVSCTDSKPVILHYNNWAILGGVETTVVDISKELKEYKHVLCTRNSRHADPVFLSWLEELGIEHVFGTVEDVADKYLPEVIFFHNTTDHYYSGKWDCLKVAAHHCVQPCNTSFDMHWCVSDYVRKGFKEKDGLWIVSPPPVFADPFLSVQRPARMPVVGRIQSSTGWKKKSTDLFYRTMRNLERCDTFIIGHGVPEDLSGGTIKCGEMPSLLANIDIMAIWGDTTETWSKVVTEANLSGIPVVARYHADGLSEQLCKSGGGVLVNSIEGFKENIEFLANNTEEGYRIGNLGREWCLQNATTVTFRARIWDRLISLGVKK